MNHTALLAAAMVCLPAVAQTAATPDNFINARQAEVEALGESLYSTHLDSSRWMRHNVSACGAFKHHAFASFEPTTPKGIRFIAIYDLDHAAARSTNKPWEGGVRLLRLRSSSLAAPQDDAIQSALIVAFNHALLEEQAAHSSKMTPADEAVCFIHLAGELPQTIAPAVDEGEPRATEPVQVTSIQIPLAATAGTGRTGEVAFAPDGTIASASVLIQRKP